jgi:Protein of unknown function (DUF4065)
LFNSIFTTIFKRIKPGKGKMTFTVSLGGRITEKDKQIVLYICNKLCNESTFGSSVLNKILYYIDKISYIKRGKKLTSFTYKKNYYGITPNFAQLDTVLDSLKGAELIKETKSFHYGYEQKTFIPSKEAELKLFSPEEIDDINTVIEENRGLNATELGLKSKNEVAYKHAKLLEELPDFTFLLNDGDITENDLEWARKKIIEHKRLPANN